MNKQPLHTSFKLRHVFFLICTLCCGASAFAQAPTSLQYPTPNVYQASVSTVFLSPTVSGSVASYSISPALPAGLSFNTNTGVISGVPSAASPLTTYTITATNASGSTTKTISIQIFNTYFNNANGQVVFLGSSTINEVGTGTAAGDIVLYQNVVTIGGQAIDCIVRTVSVTNAAFSAYDQNNATDGSTYSSNDSNYFSPQLNLSAAGSVAFGFQFILHGTYSGGAGTNVTLQNVKLNTYDIDGNGTGIQYNEFNGFDTSELGNPTTNELVTYDATTGLTKFTSNTATNTIPVTDPKNRIRVTYKNLSDFEIIVGQSASGLAYFFLDFSVGSAFTTNATAAPSVDLNTNQAGVDNGTNGCGAGLPFTPSGQTNVAAPTALSELDVTYTNTTANIPDGANEQLLVAGGTGTTAYALNAAAGTSTTTIGGVTYTVTKTVTGTTSRYAFTNGSTFTVAQAEALLDALQYYNTTAIPTNGDRHFIVNILNTTFRSPDAEFTASLGCVGISGNIYHDANALTDNLVNSNGTSNTPLASPTAFAVLVNPANNHVLATQPISAAGAYSFGTQTPGNYLLYVNATAPAVGATFTAPTYPTSGAGTYASTGENLGSGAGNDLMVDGKLTLTLGTVNITNANFGIEIPPVTASATVNSIPNPGGFNNYTATSLFASTDADGTVDSLTITSFPTGANYIKIGATIYTNGGTCPPQSTCTPFPAGGVKIGYASGIPAQSISVDPTATGTTTVVIPFTTQDNGRIPSSNASTVTLNFVGQTTAINISGNVFDDANADGTKSAGEPYTNAAGTGQMLYAILVQTTNTYSGAPTTYASTPVTATATGYNFSNVPAGNNYTVHIASLATAPVDGDAFANVTPALAPNYIGVSTNNNGTIVASQNTNDLTISFTNLTATQTNANFGIEQLPSATNVATASQPNPGGNVKVQAPTLIGTDPEDGTYNGTSGTNTVIISALATNGTLYYNNVAVTLNQVISNYDPTKLTVDPNSGAVTVTFGYKEVDAAGKPGPQATATMAFTTLNISGIVYNDANGLLGSPVNTVDGTPVAAGTVFAVLTDNAGVVIASQANAAGGAYSFAGLDGGNYKVVLRSTTAAVGATITTETLPTNYVSTGENIGTGAGSDGTVDGILAVALTTANITNANFGIDRLPTANPVTATSQPNPGGTAQVTVPTLNGTDPEDGTLNGGTGNTVILTTMATNGTLYYNGVATTTGQVINNYDPTLLKIDPNAGAVSVTFTYQEVDAAGKPSPAATVTMPFSTLSISGIIYDDANGLLGSPANTVDGTPVAAGTVFAVLTDNAGVVIASQANAANGAYSFTGLDAGSYKVVLRNATATVGSTITAETLPTNYVSTGENIGAAAGSDGTVDGILAVTLTTANVTNANLGLDRLPTANAITATSQVNPGGTVKVQAPTLTGTDPEDGTYNGTSGTNTIIISTLATNGTLYYNNVAVTLNQVIANYDPTKLTVDPNSGTVTVTFGYKEVDAAGKPSPEATATMPFTGLSISGIVYDDANGLLGTPANTVDGTPVAAGTVFAVLTDNAGVVIASQANAANGVYSFTGLDAGTYKVVLRNTTAAVGSTITTETLPTNYVSTGENIGAGAGSDGTVDGILAVTLTTANLTNANFGIDRLPTANAVTATSAVNPGGTIKVQAPTLTGSDPEDGTYNGTSLTNTVIISTLATNGTLYYNNVAVTLGQTITNYDPTKLTVDPNSGAVTVTFGYKEVDAAGKPSPEATVTMPFTGLSISGIVYDDLNGLQGTPANTVDGVPVAAGTVFAVLTDNAGVVITSQANATGGTYSFTGLDAGAYKVVLRNSAPAAGNTITTETLPANYVSTGENIGAGAGNDGTVDGVLAVTLTTANVTNANFGVDQLPTANNVSGTYVNPGGTSVVQVPMLNGSDPEQGLYPGNNGNGNLDTVIITTLPATGTLYYNNIAVTAGQQINNYDPTHLTYDPPSGPSTVTFTYQEVDAALKNSPPATVTMTFTQVSISGTVYDDANGLQGTPTDLVDGTGVAAGLVYAVLVDGTAHVVTSQAVGAGGTYSFTNLDGGLYYVILRAIQPVNGASLYTSSLPANYVSTGEFIGGPGDDGSVDGILQISLINTNIINANFGIDRLPTANAVTAASQINPGGTTQVTVPTLNGTDPEDGTLNGGTGNTIILTTTATNGTLYYNGVATTAGQVINNYNPALLTVDPADGAVTVTFTYQEVDAAGKPSPTAATVTMPFSTVTLSGNVYHDANGMTDNLVAQSGSLTAIPANLYANLVNAATGNVVATAAVNNSTGAYSFSSVNGGTYNIVLSTTQGTVGAAAPAATLPAGWVNTGEQLGTGAGRDATVDGILSAVTVTMANVTNANFGIERTPASTAASYTIVSPTPHQVETLTAANGMGPLAGTDPEDGSLGTGNTFTINSLAGMNGNVLLYNNAVVTEGQVITGYNPNLLAIRFDGNSATSAMFTFSFADAAVKYSAPASYTVTWSVPLPLRLTAFAAAAANKQVDLSWTTKEESGIATFMVQHSTDGINWTEVATVPAKGDGDYAAADANPADGINLYRLQIIETNGSYSYSPTRTVAFSHSTKVTVSVYPNPVISHVTVKTDDNGKGRTVLVLDAAGKVIGQTAMDNTTDIDMSGYASGLYIIRISGNDISTTEAKVFRK